MGEENVKLQSDRLGKALKTGMVNWKSRAFVKKIARSLL